MTCAWPARGWHPAEGFFMATLVAPYFPIIYVRGYAMTPAEIADAVSSPYMGFNVGATKLRQAWDGQVRRHVFESPQCA